jgi:hypothetical protein
LSHIKELIAWRTHFHASGRRFTHNSSGQKKSIDSDHGIYRDYGGYGGPRYYRYGEDDYRGYSRPGRFRTWNGCQPGFTVQDGRCKPYRGY